VQALEVKETQVMDFKRPVRCVALDPDYARSSSRRVVSGGMAGQLIMSEKGMTPWKRSNGRMVWKFGDNTSFRRRTDIRYFMERTIYRMG
jgi:hypothetical protein